MQKWEYAYQYVFPLNQQEDAFNKLGKEGWELVCVGPRPPRATPDKPIIAKEIPDGENKGKFECFDEVLTKAQVNLKYEGKEVLFVGYADGEEWTSRKGLNNGSDNTGVFWFKRQID